MSYSFRILVGGQYYPIPDRISTKIGYEMSDVSAAEIVYKTNGINASLIDSDAVLIAYWNGVEQFDSRWVIQAGSIDDVVEGTSFKRVGKSMLDVFRKVIVRPPSGQETLRYDTSTPGGILISLMQAAQGLTPAALVGITWDFTNLVDSAGTAWPMSYSIEYARGLKYIEVIRNMVDRGLIEVRFNGYVLQAFVANGMGVDRSLTTAPGGQVVLAAGKDFLEAPEKWSVEDRAKYALVLGDDLVELTRTNATTPTGPFGREEIFISQGGTKDLGLLTMAGDNELSQVSLRREQMTRKVLILEGGEIPGVDYKAGDWILQKTDTTPDRVRVRSMVIEVNASGIPGTASIVLNDKFLENAITSARKVEGILGGAGSSNAVPVADRVDTTTPNPPSGLTLATDIYLDNHGIAKSILMADWNPPILNTDGSTITDLKEYEFQWKYPAYQADVRRNYYTNPSLRSAASGEVRRNLVTNPNFELDVAGWANYVGVPTITRTTAAGNFYSGSAALLATSDATQAVPRVQLSYLIPVTASEYVTLSAKVKLVAGSGWAANSMPYMILRGGVTPSGEWSVSYGPTPAQLTPDANGWYDMKMSGQVGALSTGQLTINIGVANGGSVLTPAGCQFLVDEVLVEKSFTPMPYFDGSTASANGLTYSWTGTANASAAIATGLIELGGFGGYLNAKLWKTPNTSPLGGNCAALYPGKSYSTLFGFGYTSSFIAANPGEYYALRFKARILGSTLGTGSRQFQPRLSTYSSGYIGDLTSWPVITLDNNWQEIVLPSTAAAQAGSTSVAFMMYKTGTWDDKAVEISDVLIQKVSGPGISPVAFFDGSTPNTVFNKTVWLGAADASQSSQSDEVGPWTTQFLTTDYANITGLDPNRDILARVRAWDETKHASDWTSQLTLVTAEDTIPPPQPSAPTLYSKLGTVTLSWDGLGVSSQAMPMDFNQLKVYMSTGPGFTPSLATQIDTLYGRGDIIVTKQTIGATRYFKTIAFDDAGNQSPTSTEVSIVVAGITGPDISDATITAQQLADGTITGAKLVDGTIGSAKVNFSARTIGGITTSYQSTAPTSPVTGDIWYDTGNNMQPKRWSGSAWVDIRDANIAAAVASSVQKIIPVGNWKSYFQPFSLDLNGPNQTGTIAIDTPITFGNYMSIFSLSGFNYISNASEILVTAAAYLYGTGPAILQTAQTSEGSTSVTVRIARKISTGTVTLLLDVTGGVWQYPRIKVDRVDLGFTIPPDSFLTGWSGSLITTTTGYDTITTPVRRDINDTHSLTQGWRTTGQTTIDGGKITTDSITALQIAANAITTSELNAGAVTAVKIAAHTITANEIAADTLTANEIAAGAITATELSAGSVIAGKIAAGVIGATEIAANAVTAGKLAAGAVVAGNVAAGAIQAGNIAAAAIQTNDLAVGAVDAQSIRLGVFNSNLVRDPSFEENYTIVAGLGSANNGVQWHITASAGVTPAVTRQDIDPTYGNGARSGRRAMALTTGSSTPTLQTLYVEGAPIPVIPGEKYVLAGYAARFESLSAGGHFFMRLSGGSTKDMTEYSAGSTPIPFDGDNAPAEGVDLIGFDRFPTSDEYQAFSGQFTIPAGVNYVAPMFILYGATSVTHVYIDDVSLIKLGQGASELTSAGLRLFGTDGLEVAAFVSNRPNYFSVSSGGNTLASVSADGKLSGQALNISGTDTDADGVPDAGAVIYGKDFTDWMWNMPWGVVAAFTHDQKSQAAIGSRVSLGELSFAPVPGRRYRITVSGLQLAGTVVDDRAMMSIRATHDDSTPQISSAVLESSVGPPFRVAGSVHTMPPMVFSQVFQNGVSGNGASLAANWQPTGPLGLIRMLLCLERYFGTGSISYDTQYGGTQFKPLRWDVEDVGPDCGDIYWWHDGGFSGTPSTVATKKTYQTVWTSTSSGTYKGSGTKRTDTSDVVQGYQSYNGDQKGLWIFPSMTSALSGSTISKIEVYAYSNFWYYNSGGTALIKVHGYSSAPASSPSMTTAITSSGWTKPGGKWVTLPSSLYAGFLSGTYKGFGVGPAGNTNNLYYGRFNGAGAKIRITYNK